MSDSLLTGVQVASIATNVPGPVACSRLVQLGAHVTKIEPPSGDALAIMAPGWYAELVDGQHVVTLDLKAADGQRSIHSILEATDVLILSSRPSALARLGLDEPSLATRFPRLCVVSIVGHRSPDGDVAGHDLTYQAHAGTLPDEGLPTTLLADLAAATEAVSAALALLLHRERSGRGGWREVALADCAHLFASPRRHGVTTPGGLLGGGLPEYGIYRARDGRIAVAALEAHFRARLLSVLGLATLDHGALATAFAAHDVAHWMALAKAHDLPIAAISAS